MYKRVKSALFGMLILAVIVRTGGWIFAASVYILNVLALWELDKAFEGIGINISLAKISVMTALLQFAAVTHNAVMIPLIVLLTIIVVFIHNIIKDNERTVSDAVYTVFAFVYSSLPFVYWIYMRNLPEGLALTWWVFVIIWFSDTGAFFVGCRFGKKKLAPHISPKKTVEGSIGGLVFCILASMLFSRVFLPLTTYGEAAALGLIVGMVSQIGDLSASQLKRYCSIKDFSNIIPGHGGILDRFDSALFSFPVAYYYMTILMQRGGL